MTSPTRGKKVQRRASTPASPYNVIGRLGQSTQGMCPQRQGDAPVRMARKVDWCMNIAKSMALQTTSFVWAPAQGAAAWFCSPFLPAITVGVGSCAFGAAACHARHGHGSDSLVGKAVGRTSTRGEHGQHAHTVTKMGCCCRGCQLTSHSRRRIYVSDAKVPVWRHQGIPHYSSGNLMPADGGPRHRVLIGRAAPPMHSRLAANTRHCFSAPSQVLPANRLSKGISRAETGGRKQMIAPSMCGRLSLKGHKNGG